MNNSSSLHRILRESGELLAHIKVSVRVFALDLTTYAFASCSSFPLKWESAELGHYRFEPKGEGTQPQACTWRSLSDHISQHVISNSWEITHSGAFHTKSAEYTGFDWFK